jgi:hypothetical protein
LASHRGTLPQTFFSTCSRLLTCFRIHPRTVGDPLLLFEARQINMNASLQYLTKSFGIALNVKTFLPEPFDLVSKRPVEFPDD